MKKIFFLLTILMLANSCQTEFNSIDQAKNEVNNKGLKNGRWVEYIIAFDQISGEVKLSNDTIDNKNYVGYRLIEYEDGYPKGRIRAFVKSNEIKFNYLVSLNEPARLDKFPDENYIDTLYFENKNMKEKIFYYHDSTYIERDSIDSSGKLLKKECLIYPKKTPPVIRQLLDEIDWKFAIEHTPYNKDFSQLSESEIKSMSLESYTVITYFPEGRIDTTISKNMTLEVVNNLIGMKKIVSKAKARIYGKSKNCKCCGKRFYKRKGWRFDDGRAKQFTKLDGESEKLTQLFWKKTGANRLFGAYGSAYRFCSMKCASQCGPYD